MSTENRDRVASPTLREITKTSWSGWAMIGVALVCVGIAGWSIYRMALYNDMAPAWNLPVLLVAVFILPGLYMLQPKEAVIQTLFGRYAGTDRSEGLRWANPFLARRRISLRARNLNVQTLKVNDQRGNPIEIGAVVVWHVQDTAQAVFEVDSYERYVEVQAEAALRHMASQYPYDEGEDIEHSVITLRGGMDVISNALQLELKARFDRAGVDVLDAKLTHLAYAPEIAQVMLRRQQAEAIISARTKIVQGAVTMVEAALKGLSERNIVVLDDERKAAMVSNLLVVLCSDRETQPIVNTGTLYN